MLAAQPRRLEALVYSQNPSVSARCAEALADLPVDWMILQDAQLASSYLLSSNFDLVLLDLDSPMGDIILSLAWPVSNSRRNGVVFGITDGEVKPDMLHRAYDALVFYPVRMASLDSELHRAMPLAEHMAKGRSMPSFISVTELNTEAREARHGILSEIAAEDAETEKRPKLMFRHSLSIIAQERAASLISAAGTIWYVHEITKDWTRLAFLVPQAGPTELIGIALLLWLCAKHRRVVEKQLRNFTAPQQQLEPAMAEVRVPVR